MSLTRHSRWLVLVATLSACLLLASGAAWGQEFLMGYFSDNLYPNGYSVDQTLRIVNPGEYSGGNLCAMIYVFNQWQKMKECCGCLITPNGLLELSVTNNLTNNPFDNLVPNSGNIKIIAAPPNDYFTLQSANGVTVPSLVNCDPAGGGTNNIAPTNGLVGWVTHEAGRHTFDGNLTEGRLIVADLSAEEQIGLQEQCYGIEQDGSGAGICYGLTASNLCDYTAQP